MSSSEELCVSLEEVDKTLNEIQNKYCPSINSTKGDCFKDNLTVLSKEFDSLGLPSIDLTQSMSKIFEEVVSGARALVQIHRRTLSQMKNVNIDNRCKDTKSSELYKIIEEYKLKTEKCRKKNLILQNNIVKLTNVETELLKQEHILKDELEKNKRYHISKQCELQREVKKLNRENQHLREMLGSDIKPRSIKDLDLAKLLRRYKDDEELYKNTIQKLQENNKDLIEEIINLRIENKSMAT